MNRPVVAVILATVLFVSGCAARQVRIAELKDQPAKYDKKTVRVTGQVTSSFGIPLVPSLCRSRSMVPSAARF
jgi:hypothetical protein